MKGNQAWIRMALGMTALMAVCCVASVYSQTPSDPVFIKHIVIDANHTPRFIWSIANSAIPWNGLSTQADVECLKNNLRETGLFSSIETQLNKLTEPEAYEIVVSLQYRLSSLRYEVEAIDVSGLDGVDSRRLQESISKSRLIGSTLSLQTADYAVFEDGLRELIRKYSGHKNQPPIFRVSVDSNEKLKVTVSSKQTKCHDKER